MLQYYTKKSKGIKMELIKPKEIEVTDIDGEVIKLTISRLPATIGREIIAKYPLSSMPKVGDYATNEETMLKMMAYVEAYKQDGEKIRLQTKALIDNFIPDGQTLLKVEWEMLKYNTSFLQVERVSGFLETIKEKIPTLATKILTQVLQHSSPKK